VTVERFVSARQPSWTELDRLLKESRGRPERLGPDVVLRLGALYRAAVADLARARRAYPGEQFAIGLEQLVARARPAIYSTESRRGSARAYLARGYWQAVSGNTRPIALAWALMLGAAILVTAWAIHDPGAASGLVPGSFVGGGAPHRAIGLGASQSASLSLQIFTNNITVTFESFAAGILFGVGPSLLLLYNGAVLGAVAGIEIGAGHTADLFELIVPHGVLELSCIAVAGAAGMRMGWALVEPGARTRAQALAAEAPRAVTLVLATAPWLILAGTIEGFVTPHKLPLPAALAVGVAAAAPYWALVAVLGRRQTASGAAFDRYASESRTGQRRSEAFASR
jgi:uncharacterized membrane protein SpoIIM required for sporulation